MSEQPTSPVLSVVFAAPSAVADRSRATLAALTTACVGLPAEVLVVGPSVAVDESAVPGVTLRVVRGPAGALVPELWGVGLRQARAPVVAFTSEEFRVAPSWAAALWDAVSAGAAGAAGSIGVAPGADVATRAVYLLRYARFAGRDPLSPTPVDDIPGDNAAYARAMLDRRGESWQDGFWEVAAHRHIQADGGRLMLVPGAQALLTSAPGVLAFARARFQHGRRFGSYRTRQLGHSRARVAFAAPLVPAVLTLRALRRVRHDGGVFRWLSTLPLVLFFAAAWALGEARGALEETTT